MTKKLRGKVEGAERFLVPQYEEAPSTFPLNSHPKQDEFSQGKSAFSSAACALRGPTVPILAFKDCGCPVMMAA